LIKTLQQYKKKLPNKIFSQVSGDAIFICALGIIFYYYEYYLRVAPGVIRPEIKLAYSINESSFGFLIGLYYWSYVPLQLLVGLLMDMLGPRKTLTIACLISALGTYLFAAGPPFLLIAQIGRFLVGFGAAFAYVGVLKLANIWLPKKMFAFVAGACSTLGMLGGITGQIFLGKLSVIYGWGKTLYFSAIFGLVFSIILLIFIKDRNPKDIVSNKLEDHRLKFITKFKLLTSELLQVIKLPDLWLNGIIGCLAYSGLSIFADTWAVSFLLAKGVDYRFATLGASIVFAGFASGGLVWGIISDLINSRKIPLIIGSLVSGFLISFIIYLPIPLLWMNVLLFLFGFFISTEVLVFAAINDLCHKEISATAAGFVNMIVMLGGLYLQPKVGVILDYCINYNDELTKFRIALSILPIGLFVAAALSLFLKSGIPQEDLAIK
jgi:MFS family permease